MNRDALLLSFMEGHKRTANEAIHSIYKSDVKSGVVRADWKFYLHLNKRLAPLARRGLIQQVGTKLGPTNRVEKVWTLTAVGQAYLHTEQTLAA